MFTGQYIRKPNSHATQNSQIGTLTDSSSGDQPSSYPIQEQTCEWSNPFGSGSCSPVYCLSSSGSMFPGVQASNSYHVPSECLTHQIHERNKIAVLWCHWIVGACNSAVVSFVFRSGFCFPFLFFLQFSRPLFHMKWYRRSKLVFYFIKIFQEKALPKYSAPTPLIYDPIHVQMVTAAKPRSPAVR